MEPLKVSIQLSRNDCICGESVFFDLAVENVSNNVLNIPTLTPENKTAGLLAKVGEKVYKGYALAGDDRDGIHSHGPRRPETMKLAPGQKMSVRGDLLVWLGQLPPGEYMIQGTYSGIGKGVLSAGVPLRVRPMNIVSADTARNGQRMRPAPPAGAAVHQEAANSSLVLAQWQSSNMPANPRLGVRAGPISANETAWAVSIPNETITAAHVLVADPKGRLRLLQVNASTGVANPPVLVKAGNAGKMLRSPLAVSDARVLAPLVDGKSGDVVLLDINTGSGAAQSLVADLGTTRPLGPYACVWEYHARVSFAWSAPNGREVKVARLPLNDPASGFVTTSVLVTDDPIFWLEGYVDIDSGIRDQPMFVQQNPSAQTQPEPEPLPPSVCLWVVTFRNGKYICTRLNVSNRSSRPEFSIPTNNVQNLRMVASVVTSRYDLGLLLADGANQLYYTGSNCRTLRPIQEIIGKPVTAAQFPGLMAAGESAVEPWVCLRYVDEAHVIQYALLEPIKPKETTEPAQ